MKNRSPIKIFLVHHERLVLDVLPGALHRRDEVLVVGQSQSVDDALEQFSNPDLAEEVEVVLFDFTLDRSQNLIEMRRLREALPRARFVAYGLKDPRDAQPFLRADVQSFVPHNAHLSEIVDAVLQHINLTPEMLDMLIEEIRAMEPEPPEGDLSPRQFEVLQRMAKGLSNQQIAIQMSVGDSTIRDHVRKILNKLGAANRLAALHRAVQVGWIPQPGEGDGDAEAYISPSLR